MSDTNSDDLRDLLVYTTGTEVSGLGGNFTQGGFSGIRHEFNEANEANPGTRIRGLAAADNTRNLFKSVIPFDSYNLDRVEINRGSNSALFGLGSPAGIINSTLIRPHFSNTTEVGFQVDSWGGVPGRHWILIEV